MSPDLLMRCTRAVPARALVFAPLLTSTMETFEIVTPERQAAFLAQVAHESASLWYTVEIWGPTTQQLRYEPSSDLARRLGNTAAGDGKRYRGHGLLQVTGRANHRTARDRLRKIFGDDEVPDFEAHPERLADPVWAARGAGEFWTRNGCNDLADACTRAPTAFEALTRRINGGLNGIDSRRQRWAEARQALGVHTDLRT